jgi:ribosome small subunit-dependent GTPase A
LPTHRSPLTTHASPGLLAGCIVAAFGRRCLVELPDSSTLDCVTRGRRGALACGDRVSVARTASGQGVIESVAPRSTLLYRSDRARQKLIAANVTRIVVVVAPVPTFHEDLVNRCLAAAEHGGIEALIVLNKVDLPQAAAALQGLELYRRLGYPLLALSAKRDLSPLRPHLQGRTSVLVGQSGMGKSTIINTLLPQAAVRVAEISAALDSGRHTTRTPGSTTSTRRATSSTRPACRNSACTTWNPTSSRTPSSSSARTWGTAASATAATSPSPAAPSPPPASAAKSARAGWRATARSCATASRNSRSFAFRLPLQPSRPRARRPCHHSP